MKMKTMKMINKIYEYIKNKEFSFWSDIADNCTDEEATNKIYKCLKFQTIQLILYLPLISLLHYIAITQLELANILIPIISVVILSPLSFFYLLNIFLLEFL